jgi:hypothetical protein
MIERHVVSFLHINSDIDVAGRDCVSIGVRPRLKWDATQTTFMVTCRFGMTWITSIFR